MQRIVHMHIDGDPVKDEEGVIDCLSNGLGWPVGRISRATADDRARITAGPKDNRYDGPDYYWMIELPAGIERVMADAEATNLHYFAAIWTQTWGTVPLHVEAAMTW